MKNVFAILILALVLSSCKKDPKSGEVTLQINHKVANAPFVLNEMNFESPVGHSYEITKLTYYISEVTFVGEDGAETTKSGAHLVKTDDAKTLKYVLNDLKSGAYQKIRFQFGIDKAHNIDSYLPATLDNQNMEWPVQMEVATEKGAYHYMKFEGRYDSLKTGIIKSFIYHSGPTNGADNSFTVTLDLNKFELNDNSFTLNLNADVQEFLQNPTSYDFKDYSMVMEDQSIQDIYKANGQSVFTAGEMIENAK